MYNLIWTYVTQKRSQWQQHMKEFMLILYCEIQQTPCLEEMQAK